MRLHYALDDARAKIKRNTQYFELVVNRGLYRDGWMASALSFVPWESNRSGFDLDKQKWELYNIDFPLFTDSNHGLNLKFWKSCNA